MPNLCQPTSNLSHIKPPRCDTASLHIASVSAQISLCQPMSSRRHTCWRGIVSPCAKHRDGKRRRGSAGAPHRPYRGTRNIVRPHKHLTGGVRLINILAAGLPQAYLYSISSRYPSKILFFEAKPTENLADGDSHIFITSGLPGLHQPICPQRAGRGARPRFLLLTHA